MYVYIVSDFFVASTIHIYIIVARAPLKLACFAQQHANMTLTPQKVMGAHVTKSFYTNTSTHISTTRIINKYL